MLNNLTMFLRYDKICVTLLTERDDGRYMNVLKLNETTIDRYVFIPPTGRDNDRSIQRNNRTTSFQIISAKLKCSVKCDANSILLDTFIDKIMYQTFYNMAVLYHLHQLHSDFLSSHNHVNIFQNVTLVSNEKLCCSINLNRTQQWCTELF